MARPDARRCDFATVTAVELARDGHDDTRGSMLPFRLLLAALSLVSLAATVTGCAPDTSVRGDLTARIARSDRGPDYTFSYEALGSPILDCTMPNRRFTGRADRHGVAIFDGQGRPLAVTEDDRRFVHRRLFVKSTSATWIEVGEDDALIELVGPDLAGYLGSTQPPSTPWETLTASLDDAGGVKRNRGTSQSDAATFTVAVDLSDQDEGASVHLVARFKDRGTLAEFTVSQGGADGDERYEAGWRLTIGTSGVPARPDVSDAVAYDETMRPVKAGSTSTSCELGGP